MASTIVADPVAAGLTVTLGCDALENVFDVWPCLLIPSGHQTWSISSTLFTAGYTGSHESNALLFQVLASAVRVRIMGVSTVNDDVTCFAVWQELLNEVVDSGACHDKEHHFSGFLKLLAELLDRVCADNGLALGTYLAAPDIRNEERHTLGFIIQKAVDLGDGSVEGNDGKAMVSSVQDQILAHDSQANEAKISTGFRLRRSTDIDAGETRTTVSVTSLSIPCAMMKNVQRRKRSRVRHVNGSRVRLASCENGL
jgi:hypothetical protein